MDAAQLWIYAKIGGVLVATLGSFAAAVTAVVSNRSAIAHMNKRMDNQDLFMRELATSMRAGLDDLGKRTGLAAAEIKALEQHVYILDAHIGESNARTEKVVGDFVRVVRSNHKRQSRKIVKLAAEIAEVRENGCAARRVRGNGSGHCTPEV